MSKNSQKEPRVSQARRVGEAERRGRRTPPSTVHAVWQLPDGRLVDVTPTADGEGRVLFLRDRKRRYDSRLSPSRQRALAGDAREYVRFCERRWSLEAEGGNETGVALEGAARREYEATRRAARDALAMLVAVRGRSSPLCGVKAVDDHRIRIARPVLGSASWHVLPGCDEYGI